MATAALVTWLLTATAGFIMLGQWVSRGGHRPGSGSRLSPGLVFSHFPLAAIGLVLWIIYVIQPSDTLAWIAFVVLLPVALLGFTMFARWLPTVRAGTGTPESRFPIAIVIGHGLLAATTLVLVLLTALSA